MRRFRTPDFRSGREAKACRVLRLFGAGILALGAASAAAQSLPDSPQPATPAPPQNATPVPPAPETQAERHEKAEEQLKAEEQQRIVGVIPMFNAVLGGQAEPLSPGEKFRLFFRGSVDPFQFVAAGIDAGIEQAENSYPEYHQGIAGYARRYGAAFADSFDGNFWGNAVLPSLLHQDPRYFRLGHGSFSSRLGYSLLSTVRCKGDNGQWQPSYSNIGGNFIGGAISNAYYPASDRGVGLTIERGATVTAEGAIGSLLVEFYPDAIAYLTRKHHKAVQP